MLKKSDHTFCLNVILINPGPATLTLSTPGKFEIYTIKFSAIIFGLSFKSLLKIIAKFVDISPLIEFLGGSKVNFLSMSSTMKEYLKSDLNFSTASIKWLK